jgi:hypothetical protein
MFKGIITGFHMPGFTGTGAIEKLVWGLNTVTVSMVSGIT